MILNDKVQIMNSFFSQTLMSQMNSVKLDDISQFRSQLMGLAIIWVTLYHMNFSFAPIRVFTMLGFTGVDIFLFLSGLGLYYSMCKNDSVLSFYERRAKRILPTYYLIGLLYSFIYNNDSVITYLWRYTTLGFWTDGVYHEWFTASIIFLYFVFPFLFYSIKAKGNIVFYPIILISSLLALYACFVNISSINAPHFYLLYRMPVFLCGIIIAHALINNSTESIDKNKKGFVFVGLCLFVLLFILGFVILGYERARYLSTTTLTPVILLITVEAFKQFKSKLSVLSMIGGASFEIYLLQDLPRWWVENNTSLFETSYSDVAKLFLTIIIIVCCIAIHKLLAYVLKLS